MNCPHKQRYADKKAAVSAAAVRLRARRNRPAHLRPYHCSRCDGWHLTEDKEQHWKRTRAQRGERKARKHSRRDHRPARFYQMPTDE